MHRTHERLRELGFPTVPQVQLSLADFQEDPLEACQQWAQAVGAQLEARTRVQAEALVSRAREATRVTRSPFAAAGLAPYSSSGSPSARLPVLWIVLEATATGQEALRTFCGPRHRLSISCMLMWFMAPIIMSYL